MRENNWLFVIIVQTYLVNEGKRGKILPPHGMGKTNIPLENSHLKVYSQYFLVVKVICMVSK